MGENLDAPHYKHEG